jgi:hypothetical protein
MATTVNLAFEDRKYKISSYENIDDPIALLKKVSPKAYAQTTVGQHYYKVILPYYRKLACDNKESWRYLENQERCQKHIISGYSEVDEFQYDPEIPF